MITIEGKEYELRFTQGSIKKIWAEINCKNFEDIQKYLTATSKDVLEQANFAAICAFYGGQHNEGFSKTLQELEDKIETLDQIADSVIQFTKDMFTYYGIKVVEPNVEVSEEKK